VSYRIRRPLCGVADPTTANHPLDVPSDVMWRIGPDPSRSTSSLFQTVLELNLTQILQLSEADVSVSAW
jgi:hypothetical protein